MNSPLLNVRTILGLILALMLVACGSSSNSNSSNTTKGPGVSGAVYAQQGPVAEAAVVLKTSNGEALGTAITDANGEYYIPTTVAGPYIAQATLPNGGGTLYSISQNDRMNMTHLGDFMLKRWYAAYSLTLDPSLFGNLALETPVPEQGAMDGAVDQILGTIIGALRLESLDLFQDQISTVLGNVLQRTVISGNTVTITMTDPAMTVSITVDTVIDSNRGGVVFSGQETTVTAKLGGEMFGLASLLGTGVLGHDQHQLVASFQEISGVIERVLKAVSPIGEAYAATTITTNVTAVVDNTKMTEANENWMSDNWNVIKDKKLANIVIPGTHDSGTYKLISGEGINTAKTQSHSIGQQLKDGIRYFDMRVTEATHTGCADHSVWWLFHNWKSHRLQESLDEIKLFVSKPGNQKEVIILDFQDIATKYDDARAIDVLLDLIQQKLGAHMASMDQAQSWQNSSLQDFIAQGRQIVVLVPGGTSSRVNAPGFAPGCGAKFDGKYFSARNSNLRSYYVELDQSRQIQEQVISPQLQKDFAAGNSLFNEYKTQQAAGLLNVIQIVTRPSYAWYAAASILKIGFPNDLLTYTGLQINAPLNFNISSAEMDRILLAPHIQPQIQCKTGWLGKRLRMGVQGHSANWNKPNIIIVDNYNPLVNAVNLDWVLPKYVNGGWVSDSQGSYVEFIIRLNQLSSDPLLPTIPDFADASCLS